MAKLPHIDDCSLKPDSYQLYQTDDSGVILRVRVATEEINLPKLRTRRERIAVELAGLPQEKAIPKGADAGVCEAIEAYNTFVANPDRRAALEADLEEIDALLMECGESLEGSRGN